MISNCSAAGADSVAKGPAGIVQRKDATTGAIQPATVRPNGVAEKPQPSTAITSTQPATSTLAALLSLQEV